MKIYGLASAQNYHVTRDHTERVCLKFLQNRLVYFVRETSNGREKKKEGFYITLHKFKEQQRELSNLVLGDLSSTIR